MQSKLKALSGFAHVLATAPTSSEVKDLLVESAVDVIGADAAVLVRIDAAGGAQIVADCRYDIDIPLNVEVMGGELTARLLRAAGGRFASSALLPLVAMGGLYGVLVLLFERERALTEEELTLAEMIVDIGAATLARGQEIDELERAYDELKSSRQALAQAEKLRALGGMAAGITHDLKNVFGPILMAIDVMQQSNENADATRKRLDMLRRPLENGLAIVERLRMFSKRPAGEPEGADVDAIVDDAVDLCRPRISHGGRAVALKIERGDAPIVRVDVGDAVAAVTNLIVNALDAAPRNGAEIRVRTGARGGGAFIEVVDNGPGVPKDARERIFEQFYTTKGKAGTGLGLALVRDFVQRHAGTVDVDDAPEGGARFTLWFPAAHD